MIPRLPTVAEFMANRGPSGIFNLVQPFFVQVIGAPWPGQGGVVSLVAYTNEAPDGALYGFVEPNDPATDEWHLVTLALGWNEATSTIWTYVPPRTIEWPYLWLSANVYLAIAAAIRIERFRAAQVKLGEQRELALAIRKVDHG